MIIEKKEEDIVVLQSDFKQDGFQIDKSDLSIVFSTISEGLYSDPIASLIREIVSNAADATTEAGKTDPVLVTLDSDEGGVFLSIKDFGVGLSPDRIENVYKKLFKSTKRDTNDQIGAFGLGRFSIFSYTNNFYLTTVHNGVKYSYQLFLTDGVPQMVDLFTQPVTEINSTDVKIYIKKDDIKVFREKIASTLVYFKNVYVQDSLRVNSGDTIFNNEHKIIEADTFLYSTQEPDDRLHISLGGVYYPINWNALGIIPINMPCALKLNVGDLPVTRSREEIKYTPEAVNKLTEAINNFKQEINTIYKTQTKSNIAEEENFADLLGNIGNVVDSIKVKDVYIRLCSNVLLTSFKKYYYDDGALKFYNSYDFCTVINCLGIELHKLNSSSLSKYASPITSFSLRTGHYKNKVLYKYSSEPLTKKIIEAANRAGYKYVAIITKPKRLTYSLAETGAEFLSKPFEGNEKLTKNYRLFVQAAVNFVTKLMGAYDIKHIRHIKPVQKSIALLSESVRTIHTTSRNQSTKYIKSADELEKSMFIGNIAIKKIEDLRLLFDNFTVIKATKSQIKELGITCKSMEDLAMMPRMRDVLLMYKIAKEYPRVNFKYVGTLVMSEKMMQLSTYYSSKTKIGQNDVLDELLEIYEEKFPLDITKYKQELINLEKLSKFIDLISGDRGLTFEEKVEAYTMICRNFKFVYNPLFYNVEFWKSLAGFMTKEFDLNYNQRDILEKKDSELYDLYQKMRFTGNIEPKYFTKFTDEFIARIIDLAKTHETIYNYTSSLLSEQNSTPF